MFVSTSARFDDIMKQQLLYGFQNGTIKVRKTPAMMTSMVPENKNRVDTAPLPATLVDALRPSKSRAIVVTESVKPFRVVDVNACWENLCGYTFCESKGKTLGELLKGPETNAVAATGLIAKLLLGEVEASTTLVNYTKLGRRFENRIRVGPLTDEAGNVTHFVGLLQEI